MVTLHHAGAIGRYAGQTRRSNKAPNILLNRLAHVPEKLALGHDPRVDAGFRKTKMRVP
jgi:hypothetical protein